MPEARHCLAHGLKLPRDERDERLAEIRGPLCYLYCWALVGGTVIDVGWRCQYARAFAGPHRAGTKRSGGDNSAVMSARHAVSRATASPRASRAHADGVVLAHVRRFTSFSPRSSGEFADPDRGSLRAIAR